MSVYHPAYNLRERNAKLDLCVFCLDFFFLVHLLVYNAHYVVYSRLSQDWTYANMFQFLQKSVREFIVHIHNVCSKLCCVYIFDSDLMSRCHQYACVLGENLNFFIFCAQ